MHGGIKWNSSITFVGISSGLEKKDIILTTPISFLATSNTIFYTPEPKPEFVDGGNKDTSNIDPELLSKKIIKLKNTKKRLLLLSAPIMLGTHVIGKKIKQISNKFNLKLINDNCHAFGASIKNDKKICIEVC